MIREAYETDIPAIAELEKLCFSDPWSQKSLRHTLLENGSLFLVAEEHGEVCGYLNSSCILDECSLNRICVAPQFQNRRIASKMMEKFIETCDSRNIEYIHLEVRESNLYAQRLYESFGFKALWIRLGFYQNPDEAAIVMQRCKEEQL